MLNDLKKSLGTDGRSRGITKKLVALVAFGAIILVFVFMGIDTNNLGMGGGGVVAQVNNVTISVGQFRTQVERLERQFGGSNPAFAQFIRRQALENLIGQEVVYQKSQSEGLLVSDDEVRDIVVNLDVFKEDGRFQPVRYEELLRQNRLTMSQFEAGIRKDASADRLRRLVAAAVVPTKGEVERQQVASTRKADLEYVSFSQEELAEKLAKSVKYDGVVSEDLKKKVEDYYSKNIADYTQQEEVKAQHILIKTEKHSEEEALAKIKQIAKEAKNGNFAELAEKYSEDVGSQKKGGDLGYFGRGQMVQPFEDTVFTMEVGQISEPVKSQFGYHLIKLNDKKKAEVKKLDDVRDEVTRIVMAEEQVAKDIEELEGSLKEKKYAQINQFVKRFDLSWKSTGAFDLSADTIPDIGASESLIEEAFALSESRPYPQQVHRLSGQAFLVKYKPVEAGKEPQAIDQIQAEMAESQVRDALGRLTEQWKDSSAIERNSQYIEANPL